ncbi:hypothetical protein ABOM_009463 [Aspergillus bombycis]|uniref:Cyanovirin-N domain-containing protein n=1 Tax=Aspergillus bombycis TaxID=109264 RepID=A0A1F7ZQP2_9EURO|nr:hypothetical protein ABOM_009463 [Aspergillus bombycis]OGM41737.1 hypothetical protein ABOM_009463 [Aspergillus bombycis]
MRLLLPFIVLPLAALAAPPSISDLLQKPVDPNAGNFSFSCKDVKLDGEPKPDAKVGDAVHHLVATCAVGDGTEITSKLDLNHCYAQYEAKKEQWEWAQQLFEMQHDAIQALSTGSL